MSRPIVDHVWDKSQSQGSGRTMLLTLAIRANDCCGVAWYSDETLYHKVNVSRQRIHELKNAWEARGELAIVERPGTTNLYCIAKDGVPLGPQGEYAPGGPRQGQHEPHCPLRDPTLARVMARRWPQVFPMPKGVSDPPDPPVASAPVLSEEVSENSDPSDDRDVRGVSEISNRRCQNSLTQEKKITKETNVHNVRDNVRISRVPKPPPLQLTAREDSIAQEIARHLDGDDHSLGAMRRIVSEQQGLGEDIATRLYADTMEQLEARKITTTPGRYFIDLAKREAARLGIDLGFRPGRGQRSGGEETR